MSKPPPRVGVVDVDVGPAVCRRRQVRGPCYSPPRTPSSPVIEGAHHRVVTGRIDVPAEEVRTEDWCPGQHCRRCGFALQRLDANETADCYELVVARHQAASTVVTSSRGTGEWLAMMIDPLLAQSAVDWLTSVAHELVIDGDSYRRRQKPATPTTSAPMPTEPTRWSHARGKAPVPSLGSGALCVIHGRRVVHSGQMHH